MSRRGDAGPLAPRPHGAGTQCPDEGAPPPRHARRISSRSLFAGAREVEIEHDGDVYRLRETHRGKLILTK
jgi:hemin uptake protein HemP